MLQTVALVGADRLRVFELRRLGIELGHAIRELALERIDHTSDAVLGALAQAAHVGAGVLADPSTRAMAASAGSFRSRGSAMIFTSRAPSGPMVKASIATKLTEAS